MVVVVLKPTMIHAFILCIIAPIYIRVALALSVPQKKIFCFGDSLTAGSSPPLSQDFPYAPHLEQKLRNNYAYGCGSAMVRFKGYPGWTTKTLFEGGGLGSTLDKVESAAGKVDLAIILAGTNDLAYDSDADSIFNTLRKIHGVAHSRQIKTIAVGIPPSAWQQQSSVAREVAGKVNAKLQEMNTNDGGLSAFVPFPITDFDRSSGYWCSDGLHFSPEGYRFLGESLAPVVANALGCK